MFALDSIPAAFAVSEDRFILYSSNLFAILGLRALYLVLEDALQKLRYLKVGLVGVLGFAGVKLLVAPWLHVPPLASVAVIVAVIGAVVVASLGANARDRSRSLSVREVPRAGHLEPLDPSHVP